MTSLPTIETEEAFILREAFVRGSTTQLHETTILWIGEHLFLIRVRGTSYQGSWFSSKVMLVVKGSRDKRKTVWSVKRKKSPNDSSSGPLTQGVLKSLILLAETKDQEWPNFLEEEGRRKAKELSERGRRLTREMAVKIHQENLLKASLDEGCDDSLPGLAKLYRDAFRDREDLLTSNTKD